MITEYRPAAPKVFEANEASDADISIHNTGAGETMFVVDRSAGVVNKWRAGMLLGSGRYTIASDLLDIVLQLSMGAIAVDETGLLILSNNSGVSAVRRVSTGANDSAGTGFRQLRVSNA